MSPKPSKASSGTRRCAAGNKRDERPEMEYFRNCFSEFPDPVIVTDINGLVLFLNHAAQSLTGRSVAEGRPVSCVDILNTGADSLRGPPIEAWFAVQGPGPVQVRVRNHAGDWLPFSLSAQKITGRDGKPVGCVGIMREAPATTSGTNNNFLAPIFSSVINNFPIPFFTVDSNLTVTYMNQLLEKLTGYDRDEVIGRMSCADLLKTPYCHTDDCLVKQSMAKRIPLAGVRRVVIDREGRNIPVAVHCSIITDREDRVVGGFKAMRDITPLVEAEQKIRVLVDITPEGILMLDENDRVIYANSTMAEIFARPRDELIGLDAQEFLPSRYLGIAHDMAQRLDAENYQKLHLCIIDPALSPNLEERTFEACIVVARVGEGPTTFMYFHDLSKRIEIERQLFSANSFLENIIKSSADGIVVVDIKGKVLVFNESAERILGYSSEEMMADPRALFKIAGPDLTREIMRRLRNGGYGPPGKLTSTRIHLNTKDGDEVPVNFSAAIIKKEDREIGSVGIFSDLREHLRILKELEDAKMQLLQAEKIASVGRLAAGVAHEINNPLSGILIYADMLYKEMEQNPQWSSDLQEIINQTLRCKQIVKRLLDFSRQSAGQKVSYDMNNIITRSFELLLRQALFQDVEFSVELDPSIPSMVGDPSQLQQVFTNLLINSANAMCGKGKITITSRFDPESSQVILQFWDTGPGIPEDIVNKLFEPFFTTKAPGEGTGLGLSVAYGIIQQHGGHIEGTNSPSGGALFTIILPLDCPEKTIEYM